jgi:hypothetical protein
VFALAVFLFSCAPVPQGVAQEQTPQLQRELADLWIDLSMGPPLVAWFNETARPDDIARAEHVALMGMLDEITAGQRLVVFKSAADAREAMPFIGDRIDVLGYNLERGPANPTNEQADPVTAVKIMQDLAKQYGVKLAIGPDRDFALQYGPALAPYVDIFVLQVQRVQTEPATVRDFVVPLAAELRKANPGIQISVQVRTEGDVEQIADLLESLLGSIEGVSILTSPETVDIAQNLVTEIRSRTEPANVPGPTATSSAADERVPRAQAAELATATVRPTTAVATATARPLPTAMPFTTTAPTRAAVVERSVQATVAPVAVATPAAAPALVPVTLQRFLVPLAGLMILAAIGGGVIGAVIVLASRHKP